MGINLLPSSTSQLLGSSLSIEGPLALVKELLDNSIDAGATYVDILISSNTVDKIQVRDNGRGISNQDFDSLGRRSHTSKLCTINELQQGKVNTLGFRGQALASVNDIATVTIITKTLNDFLASQIRLKFGVGGVEDLHPVPAPVGTTVRVNGLFEGLPVRKQFVLKQRRKSLAGIKDLLRAYALALPKLKLVFKVMGDSLQGWTYTPSQSPTLENAAQQIFGMSLSKQCIYTEITLKDDLSDLGDSVGAMKALLPKVTTDTALSRMRGVFISVNSRPLSASQGLPEKIVFAVKSRLRQLRVSSLGLDNSLIPFMVLNMTCRPENCDLNVAPLKDEVIFAEEEKIIQCFENLCDNIYKEPKLGNAIRAMEDVGTDGIEPHSSNDPALLAADYGESANAPSQDYPLPNADKREAQQSCLSRGPGLQAAFRDSEVSNKSLELVRMRTSFRVNLARTTSNTVADDDDDDSTLIEPPLEPLMPKKCLGVIKKPVKPSQQLGKALKSEDIHHYFKPKRGLDLEIMTAKRSSTGNAFEQSEARQSGRISNWGQEKQVLQTASESVKTVLQVEPRLGRGQGSDAPGCTQSLTSLGTNSPRRSSSAQTKRYQATQKMNPVSPEIDLDNVHPELREAYSRLPLGRDLRRPPSPNIRLSIATEPRPDQHEASSSMENQTPIRAERRSDFRDGRTPYPQERNPGSHPPVQYGAEHRTPKAPKLCLGPYGHSEGGILKSSTTANGASTNDASIREPQLAMRQLQPVTSFMLTPPHGSRQCMSTDEVAPASDAVNSGTANNQGRVGPVTPTASLQQIARISCDDEISSIPSGRVTKPSYTQNLVHVYCVSIERVAHLMKESHNRSGEVFDSLRFENMADAVDIERLLNAVVNAWRIG